MKDFIGNITVEEVKENEDGTATIHFEISDEFKENYIDIYSLKEWDDSHFEKMMLDAITKSVSEKKCEDNVKDSEFLWGHK